MGGRGYAMGKIRRFEDVIAWQRAREFTREIYEMSSTHPFSRDFALKDQIRRAAISVMANIAEGFERNGNKEFSQFLSYAKGSLGEVRAFLYVALDAEFIDRTSFERLLQRSTETACLISGLMRYLSRSEYKGWRHLR